MLTAFLKRNWATVVAMVVLAACLLSFGGYSLVDPQNNTDSSWAYSLAGLRHDTQVLGRDVFFTYGPLYQQMVTTVHQQDNLANFLISNLIFIAIMAASLYALYRLIILYKLNDTSQGRLLLLLSSLAMVLTLPAIDTLFYIILLITLLAVHKEGSYPLKLLLLSGVYLFSFYKFNLAIPTIGLSLLALIQAPVWRRIGRGALEWLGSLMMLMIMYFGLVGWVSFSGFFNYVHFGVSNSLAYNEFMSLPYSQYPKLVLAYTLAVAILFVLWLWRLYRLWRQRQLTKSFDFLIGSFIFGTIEFFAFKHGIIRTRLAEFTAFLFPMMVFGYLLARPKDFSKKNAYPIFRAIMLIIFMFTVGSYLVYYSQLAPKPYKKGERAPTFATYLKSRRDLLESATIHNRFNYAYFNQEKAQAKHDTDNRAKFVSSIKDQLDRTYPGRELLFYGNVTIYGDVLKQSHPVLLMPGVQNYAANPPQLFDQRYINFLDSHPNDLVFAEETEPSVDNRIPAHELNQFFQYLIHNYRLVLMDTAKRQYVFERVSSSKESCYPMGQVDVSDDVSFPVPSLPAGATYLKLRLNSLSDSPVAKAAAAFVKAPTYHLNLTRVEDVTMTMRTTPTLLEHGVAVSPLYLSLGDYFNHTPLPLKAISINDGFPTRSNYKIEFESCHF